MIGCNGGSGLPNATALRTNHHPASTIVGTTQRGRVDERGAGGQQRTTTSTRSSSASDPDRLLGEHGEGDRKPGPESETRRQHLALHHDDPGEHEQGAGEPGEVVVVDRSCQVLRLGEQRDQGRGSDGQRRPEREEAPRHQRRR